MTLQWHGYFAIEDLNLTPTQRQTLIQALRALGPSNHPQPCMLNHWRVSLDGTKAIFEARFDEDNLTPAWFAARLASLFGIDPQTIDVDTRTICFAERNTPIATFSRAGTDYLRMALFGGLSATWPQSRTEAAAYIAVHSAQWEEPIDSLIPFEARSISLFGRRVPVSTHVIPWIRRIIARRGGYETRPLEAQ